MKQELVDILKQKYPELYDTEHKYGGFAIGDGWFDIINCLSNNIQSHIKWKNRETEVVAPVVIEQIKEKFGGLRFYFQGGDEYIHGLASMAESMSTVTCEDCGNVGKQRGGGWVRTLCDQHEAEYQAKRNSDE